ncbi:MAG TPA: peptide deformylase [Oscillospiraceae bacterium]|nr:peptide deformylase [Oscillospiraceae bacterium]
MALRTIVLSDDELLKKRSKMVTAFDEKLWQLLDDMAETLEEANGVGLAAPQVGILRRVVIIDIGEGLIELINPEIVSAKGKQREVEGCLSCPGKWGFVERPEKVKVKAFDRFGKPFMVEGTELLAIAMSHEIDHLNGVLFVDIADEMVDPNSVEEVQ